MAKSNDNDLGAPQSVTVEDHKQIDALMDSVFGKEEPANNDAPVAPEKNNEPPKNQTPPTPPPSANDKNQVAGKINLDSSKDGKKVENQNQNLGDPSKATPPPIQVVKDAEIDAINEPKGTSQEGKENWKKLRELTRTYKKTSEDFKTQISDRDNKIKELTQVLQNQSNKLPEAVQKELDDLRQLRRTFALEKDPEFSKEFNEKISKNNSDIEKILLGQLIPKDTLEDLKAKGFTNINHGWWEQNVIKPLLESESADDNKQGIILRDLLRENILLDANRKKKLDEASVAQSEYLKNMEANMKKDKEDEQKAIEEFVANNIKDHPWAKRVEVPKTGSQEEIKAAMDHNAFVEQSERVFVNALYPKDMQTKIEAAGAAVWAFNLQNELKNEKEARATEKAQLESQMNALLEELNKIKGSSSTRKNGAAIPNDKPKKENRISLSNEEAVDIGMQEAGIG